MSAQRPSLVSVPNDAPSPRRQKPRRPTALLLLGAFCCLHAAADAATVVVCAHVNGQRICREFVLPGDKDCDNIEKNPKYENQDCFDKSVIGVDPGSEIGVGLGSPLSGSAVLGRVGAFSVLSTPDDSPVGGLVLASDVEPVAAPLPPAPVHDPSEVLMTGVLYPGETELVTIAGDPVSGFEPLPSAADFGIAYAVLDAESFSVVSMQVEPVTISQLSFQPVPEPSAVCGALLALGCFATGSTRRRLG